MFGVGPDPECGGRGGRRGGAAAWGRLSHPPLATAPRPTWAEEFTITLQGHTAGALRWELHRGADPATLAFAEVRRPLSSAGIGKVTPPVAFGGEGRKTPPK